MALKDPVQTLFLSQVNCKPAPVIQNLRVAISYIMPQQGFVFAYIVIQCALPLPTYIFYHYNECLVLPPPPSSTK